jgi:hypothetical protein
LAIFRLFAGLRLVEGCSHSRLQHRFLEDLAARGELTTFSCDPQRKPRLDEAEIRELARAWAEEPPQPLPDDYARRLQADDREPWWQKVIEQPIE